MPWCVFIFFNQRLTTRRVLVVVVDLNIAQKAHIVVGEIYDKLSI